MELYQWLTIGLGVFGFLTTWILGAFKLGRAVEQMKSAVKKDIELERDKIVKMIDELKDRFDDEQRAQDQRFGEVGAAGRQYTADVEKKVREVEIWGRDNYVQKGEFDRATESIRQDLREFARSIKEDFRVLHQKIDQRQDG
jgi:hypothetical protein